MKKYLEVNVIQIPDKQTSVYSLEDRRHYAGPGWYVVLKNKVAYLVEVPTKFIQAAIVFPVMEKAQLKALLHDSPEEIPVTCSESRSSTPGTPADSVSMRVHCEVVKILTGAIVKSRTDNNGPIHGYLNGPKQTPMDMGQTERLKD